MTELTSLLHGLFPGRSAHLVTDDLCVQVRELTSLQQDVLKEVLTNTQDDVKNIVQSRESSCK